MLPALLTQQAGTGYSNSLSTPVSKGTLPDAKATPEPFLSPGHTDCAQLQSFIVEQDRGTPHAVPHSPHSHTTNLVLVRDPLLVAVSAWAWYPMATFCDKPRCSL